MRAAWFAFKYRLPAGGELFSVFGLIVFISFTWSLVNAFWRLSSWLMFMTLGEVASVFAYVLMNCLLESALALAFVTALALILPRAALRERFVARGGAFVFFASLWAALLDFILAWNTLGRAQLLGIAVLFAASAFLLLYFLRRVPALERGMEKFCEQVGVFIYVYVPLGTLGLAVVIVRNIFGGTV